MNKSQTLGELRASGWTYRSVKKELMENMVARMTAGEPLFPGILGYDETVIPEMENAILSGHDILILGETGSGQEPVDPDPGSAPGRMDAGGGRL